MPRGDRTGPEGMGRMTGRSLGYCANYDSPGFTRGVPRGGGGFFSRMGRRFGPGPGRRWNWNNYPAEQPAPQYSAEAETDVLKTGISALKAELKAMEERLSQLMKKEK